ncbi:MAG: methyl-accepting chemotaxis protein [Thermodesulfobacteriota bacterium]|nr:methyl-accepting chemotaxis protein [Thermodesulfobacteriota bacterium]
MKIRSKLVLTGIFIVIISMMISTLITSLIVNKQNRESALRNLEQGFVVIKDYMEHKKKTLLKQTIQIASTEGLGIKVNVFTESKLNPDMSSVIESQNRDVAKTLYQTTLMENLWRTAVYDIDGDIMAFAVISEDETLLGYPLRLPHSLTFKIKTIEKGEKSDQYNWTSVDRLTDIEMVFRSPIPSDGTVEVVPIDDRMCMVSMAPIRSLEYIEKGQDIIETDKTVGFIVTTYVLDSEFIKNLSRLTNTEVNLFAGDRLCAVHNTDNRTLERTVADVFQRKSVSKSDSDGELLIKDSLLRGEFFLEGLMPLYSKGKWIGTISSLHSKEIFHKNTSRMIKTLLLVSLVCILLVLPLTLVLSNIITKPINRIVQIFHKVAGGDLTEGIKTRSKDELGMLAQSLNTMVNDLGKLVKNTKKSGEELKKASSEIESSASEQSASASEQAVTTQEISATIQEMAISSKQMAQNMTLVVDASKNTLNTVEKANEVTQESMTGMAEIKESSKLSYGKIQSLGERSQAIGDIVEIIKDVSNQTHLLALNAAIEATKAGEAGKGFSLVAEEIRKLAENVAESTKEIKAIVTEIQNAVDSSIVAIEDETKKIEKGNQLVQDSKDLLKDINRMATESTEAAEEVSEAIRQQDMGTQEVSRSVLEIAEGFNQNAEEHIKISKSLAHILEVSKVLNLAIDQFKVEKDG